MELQTIKDVAGQDEYVLVPMGLYELLRTEIDKKLKDPVLRSMLEAPYDDEEETEEEKRLVEEGREAIRQGRVISHEEMRIGLKQQKNTLL